MCPDEVCKNANQLWTLCQSYGPHGNMQDNIKLQKAHAQSSNSQNVAQGFWQGLWGHGTGWQQNGSERNKCNVQHETQWNSACTDDKQFLLPETQSLITDHRKKSPIEFKQQRGVIYSIMKQVHLCAQRTWIPWNSLEQRHKHWTCKVHVDKCSSRWADQSLEYGWKARCRSWVCCFKVTK